MRDPNSLRYSKKYNRERQAKRRERLEVKESLQKYNGIEGKDYVECKICGKRGLYIDSRHLKTRHDLTKEEYSDKFPNAFLVSKKKSKAQARPNNKCFLGHHLSDEAKIKLSLERIGEKNPAWCGGITNSGYCDLWRDTEYKESIKERDGFECKKCFTNEDLCVHHIDYDKQNCLPKNLITLCRSCNSSVNADREYWTEYFSSLME